MTDVARRAQTLAAHEAVIERAKESAVAAFVVIGVELDAIRADRSYRDAHPTFRAYCQERWGFGASRARQLIRAAKSVTAGNASGATEREVRKMLALDPAPDDSRTKRVNDLSQEIVQHEDDAERLRKELAKELDDLGEVELRWTNLTRHDRRRIPPEYVRDTLERTAELIDSGAGLTREQTARFRKMAERVAADAHHDIEHVETLMNGLDRIDELLAKRRAERKASGYRKETK